MGQRILHIGINATSVIMISITEIENGIDNHNEYRFVKNGVSYNVIG